MANLTTAYIGLGSNLADKHNSIKSALKMLARTEHIEVARVSDLIETPPLGGGDQPNYVNAVAQIHTTLTAESLHRKLADIETSLGRVRKEKWSPRVIDLDLLLFGSEIINTPDLTVPHQQMHLRSFVLSGLCRLNPELSHPLLNEPMSELTSRLNGADFVPHPNRPQLISVAGVIGVGKTTLAQKLCNSLNCNLLLEPYDKNPFLPEVYAGKKELALDSQLYFLNSRIEQLNLEALPNRQVAVSDYIFDKELIYAKRLLNPQQLASYEDVYQPAGEKVATPVLVIYLKDSAQKCLERIHTRNRPYEQVIGRQFLEKLSADYEHLFADWKLCPIIRISMSNFDCTRNGDINHLKNQIESYVAV
jgi:deoxyguanosine kinase